MQRTLLLVSAVLIGVVLGAYWRENAAHDSQVPLNPPELTVSSAPNPPTPMGSVIVEGNGNNSSPITTSEERDWLDKIGLLGTFASVIALFFIQKQISQGSSTSRIEFLPYVRIDVGPDDVSLDQSSFKPGRPTPPDYQDEPVEPYYEDKKQAIDLTDGDSNNGVVFSAWFRNYQQHSLGQAYSLSAFFAVELEDSPNDSEVPFVGVEIGYLEHGKPVKVNLCALPAGQAATIFLYELQYADVQNQHYRHSRWDEKTPNATHGRFLCVYDGRYSRSVPESWSEPERSLFVKVIRPLRRGWENFTDTMRR